MHGTAVKKTALALTLILMIVCLIGVNVSGFPLVRVAKANPYGDSDRTLWTIESPLNHTVYNTNVLNFSFKCTTNDLWDEFDDGLDLSYCIDGSDYWEEYEEGKYMHVMPPDEERIFIKAELISNPESSRKTFQYSTLLPSLSDGNHRLTVYFKFKSWGPDSPQFVSWRYEGIIFYIDTLAPTITNLSVNGTDSGDKMLSFTVGKETSWLGYSLDNQANVTISGNTTITGLSEGSHSLIVYANSTAGNMGASQTVNFAVSPEIQPIPLPESFPTTLLLGAIIIVAAVVGLGLMVYLKKRTMK